MASGPLKGERTESSKKAARQGLAGRRLGKIVIRLIMAVVVTLLFGRLLQFSVQYSQQEGAVPGFRTGFAHGMLMPCGMPVLLLGQDIPIYAARNTGRTYKLGYTLGVNFCGAIFFGSVYWRLGRLRKMAREMKEPDSGD